MAKANSTRETILAEALSQATVLGLEGISIGGLASALNLSKSGLFAHFKSKEALQLAVLEEAIDRFETGVVAPAAKIGSPLARLDALVSGYLDWIAGSKGADGCLFVTAVQEFDDRPGPLRDRLVASQMDWRRVLGDAARAAIAAGELPPKDDVELFVFELVGVGLAFQHASRFFRDPRARRLAERAYEQVKAAR